MKFLRRLRLIIKGLWLYFTGKAGIQKENQKPNERGEIPIKGRTWNPLQKFPRNEKCLCGSGKKFKNCHMSEVPRTCTIKEAEEITRQMKGAGFL